MPFVFRRAFCLFFVLFLAGALHAQTNFTTVVVFGDSLSDTGNVANLTQAATGGTIRYPSDIPSLGIDYTNGRFTDGADTQPAAQAYQGVWIEQLAASLPAKPTVKDSLDGGTNYAYGDATTATSSTTLSEGPLSITIHNMGQQVADYLGTSPAPVPNASTLYVLWGGSNDLLQAAEGGSNPVTAAGTAVMNELNLVQQLVAVGARNFMIPNLPPLGDTPEAAASGSTAVTALNAASAAFAQELAQGITSLVQGAAAQGITLNVYQPDILTEYTYIANNALLVGLGNVTAAAQNVTGSPDTYLIWDGLHPTTTGHHYAAATAANLLTPLVSSRTAVTAPAVVLANQPAILSAVVTSGKTGVTPTGLVTFFGDGTAIGSAVLDATGTATATIPASTIVTGTYAVSAVYAGDTTDNTSYSPPQTTVVLGAAVGTSTMLTTSNGSPSTGSSVTFTVTVTPAVTTYGTPAGTITFLNGTATLGTATLANGIATYTTTSLGTGTEVITASYAANGVFGASVSTAVTETVAVPSFTAAATPTSLTITDGSSGTVSLTATSTGGESGTLALTCGTLPAHLSCSFGASTLTLVSNATSQAVTLTIATNASAALTGQDRPGAWHAAEVFSATLLFPGFAGFALVGLRRRKALPGLWLTALVLLLAGTTLGLSGCGGKSSSNNAASGTYTVPVTFTPTTGSAQTVNITVIVQ